MVSPKCSFLHKKKSLIKIWIKAKTGSRKSMTVSQLCYRSAFCACMVPGGEGGVIVVRVLPAKLVLGGERQEPPGEGMGT